MYGKNVQNTKIQIIWPNYERYDLCTIQKCPKY